MRPGMPGLGLLALLLAGCAGSDNPLVDHPCARAEGALRSAAPPVADGTLAPGWCVVRGTWTPHAASVGAVEGRFSPEDRARTRPATNAPLVLTDVGGPYRGLDASVRFELVGAEDKDQVAALVFRAVDERNYVAVREGTAYSDIGVIRLENGTQTVLQRSPLAAPPGRHAWHTLGLADRGDRVDLYSDGALEGSWSAAGSVGIGDVEQPSWVPPSSVAAWGLVGLRVVGDSDVVFDGFQATPLP